MGKFLNHQRVSQAQFKQRSTAFTPRARKPGLFRGKLREFCLPADLAAENLYSEIREPAIGYLRQNGIK